MKRDPLGLEHQLCFSIYQCHRLLNQLYQSVLAPLQLTYPQYLVMLVMWQNESNNLKSIGQQLNLDSGTLTPLLKRLESKGLLRRMRDPHDERSIQLWLTKEGKSLRQQALLVPTTLAAQTGLKMKEIQRIKSEIDSLNGQLHQVNRNRKSKSI